MLTTETAAAELERRADEAVALHGEYRRAAALRLAARLLLHGGGCGCGGWIIATTEDRPTPYYAPDDDCPDCHGTGIDATTRELLSALGLEVK